MSRIESGAVVLSEEPLDIINRVEEMAGLIRQSAESKGISVCCSTDGIQNRKVFADGGRINQIILNILGNAVKYTSEGGSISITAEQLPCDVENSGKYRFVIVDTGIGMSPEYLGSIFEPFSRENSTTVSKIEGTGLGMSIVKHLVDLMGGAIEVDSEQGKGTRVSLSFTFRLQTEQADETSKKQSLSVDLLRGSRILLVEDNERNREIAKDILEDFGVLVDEAEDGDVAVEIIKSLAERKEYSYYNCVLMDIQMPRMNGYAATKAIRDIPCPPGVHLPIIAMTANAFEEDRKNAIDAGMDEHLSKPIDVQKLWETLLKFQ